MPSRLVEVNPSELGGLSRAGVQESVAGVNVAHVVENTEGKVGDDTFITIHPISDGAHEVEDLVPAALSSTTEVLASELSDEDTTTEGVAVEHDVVHELLLAGAVPVNNGVINLAAGALVHEASHPLNTAVTVSGSRGGEPVASATIGLHDLTPEGNSFTRGHVSLVLMIGLVGTKNVLRVSSGSDRLLGVGDMLPSPNHGQVLDVGEVVDTSALVGAPGVAESNSGVLEEVGEMGCIPTVPGNTDLALTARGGRRRGDDRGWCLGSGLWGSLNSGLLGGVRCLGAGDCGLGGGRDQGRGDRTSLAASPIGLCLCAPGQSMMGGVVTDEMMALEGEGGDL